MYCIPLTTDPIAPKLTPSPHAGIGNVKLQVLGAHTIQLSSLYRHYLQP